MEVPVHFIIFLHQGIAEAKTGLGDEDVKTTAVNLVMVSAESVYLLNLQSCYSYSAASTQLHHSNSICNPFKSLIPLHSFSWKTL